MRTDAFLIWQVQMRTAAFTANPTGQPPASPRSSTMKRGERSQSRPNLPHVALHYGRLKMEMRSLVQSQTDVLSLVELDRKSERGRPTQRARRPRTRQTAASDHAAWPHKAWNGQYDQAAYRDTSSSQAGMLTRVLAAQAKRDRKLLAALRGSQER